MLGLSFATGVAFGCGATVCGGGSSAQSTGGTIFSTGGTSYTSSTPSTGGGTVFGGDGDSDDGGTIVQSGERIVFVEDDDGWSAFIQILTQGPTSKFGWVIPLPEAIDPSEVTIAPDGMMDDLEAATAPTFRTDNGVVSGAAAPTSSGCGCDAGLFDDLLIDAVNVVGSAVVGPYELTLVNGHDAEGLAAWFLQGGYNVPIATYPLLDEYVLRDYSFLAVRLLPLAGKGGTVQTLKIPCGQNEPSIPITLTSVAAIANMGITAYVLSDQRYEPANDWPEVAFDPSAVTPFAGGTDYVQQLQYALDVGGGRGFRTEFAGPVDQIVGKLDMDTQKALGRGKYLTRMQSWADPAEMLSDPEFVPSAEDAPDVDNTIDLRTKGAAGMGLFAPVLFGVGLVLRRGRR